jgi:hypothetical protein
MGWSAWFSRSRSESQIVEFRLSENAPKRRLGGCLWSIDSSVDAR